MPADLKEKHDKVEKYNLLLSGGGNVLGSAFYAAKCVMGATTIMFLGADFSFGYDKKFHAWDSKYDKTGQSIRVTDIYGNRVHTWQSYNNFKVWFDLKACQVPGIYINCSSGGTFGSYDQGNIKQVIQMPLQKALEMHRIPDFIKSVVDDVKSEAIIVF